MTIVPRVSQGNLIRKRVLCLCVQFLGVRVDDGEVGSIFSQTRPGEISSQRRSHEFVALGRTGGAAVQGSLEVLGQNNKSFNAHGAMVRPSAHAEQAVPAALDSPAAPTSTTRSSACARAFNSRRRVGDNPGIEGRDRKS